MSTAEPEPGPKPSSMKSWLGERRAADGPSGAEAKPAATVVLLRDGDDGIEVLLAKRSSKLAFHGGAWVFPGGRIDPEDYADDPDDVFTAAQRAAAREAMEEAGLQVDPDALVHVSNWTTPDIAPKRFATWFFAGRAEDGDEVADGTETEALQWFSPAAALAARDAGEIELAPPQFVTLLLLADHTDVDAALCALDGIEPFDFTPRFHFVENGPAYCLYANDVAFDDVAQLDAQGPRHRLVMEKAGWAYERS
jgi:8-oxo-dGTP pyrophosphatase MutT (NUDIX family)